MKFCTEIIKVEGDDRNHVVINDGTQVSKRKRANHVHVLRAAKADFQE